MNIIYELDNDGINLQETRLNFISQGYGDRWDHWLEFMMLQTISASIISICYKTLQNKTF